MFRKLFTACSVILLLLASVVASGTTAARPKPPKAKTTKCGVPVSLDEFLMGLDYDRHLIWVAKNGTVCLAKGMMVVFETTDILENSLKVDRFPLSREEVEKRLKELKEPLSANFLATLGVSSFGVLLREEPRSSFPRLRAKGVKVGSFILGAGESTAPYADFSEATRLLEQVYQEGLPAKILGLVGSSASVRSGYGLLASIGIHPRKVEIQPAGAVITIEPYKLKG